MIETALVSCDDHLDLNMLPRDVWTQRMAAQWGERAPRVVEQENGSALWMADGEAWGGWSGAPSRFSGPKPIHTAYDRGGIEDLTELRAGNARLRLEDMDRDQVWAHVIYGPVTSIRTGDEAFMKACYSAYNDWLLEEFCDAAPERLVGVAMLPPHPEAAFEELQRLARTHGAKCRQANLQIAVCEPRLEDKRWEPLFDLLEQSGIVLSFHVTVFPKAGDAFDKYKGSPGATFLHAKMFIEQFLDPFVDLFAWGILERHPKVKIVIAESGVGWVPWVVEELDYRYWRLWECKEFWDDKGGIPHKTKPSEIFQRQVYGTFQQSPTAMRLTEFWGPDNLLWASDYPHPDSIWPNSVKTIGETMGHMKPAMVRKITGENAAALYGLDLSRATVKARLPIGPAQSRDGAWVSPVEAA